MVIREKYKEERNEIKISNKGNGYWATFMDNNYINKDQNNRQETYAHTVVKDGDFCDVLNSLADFTAGFYNKGVNLNFGEQYMSIPEREKETIEKVVKKLETLSVSHKVLLESVKKIEDIVTDDSLYESNMLADFR